MRDTASVASCGARGAATPAVGSGECAAGELTGLVAKKLKMAFEEVPGWVEAAKGRQGSANSTCERHAARIWVGLQGGEGARLELAGGEELGIGGIAAEDLREGQPLAALPQLPLQRPGDEVPRLLRADAGARAPAPRRRPPPTRSLTLQPPDPRHLNHYGTRKRVPSGTKTTPTRWLGGSGTTMWDGPSIQIFLMLRNFDFCK